MKALVIGGAGYIGSNLACELLMQGHEVVVFDNLSTGRRSNVHPAMRFFKGDVRNYADLRTLLDAEFSWKPVDVVFNFAAKLIVEESMTQPLAYYENNVEGLRVLLQAMVDYGIRKIVYSSTAAVYGDPENGVCKEDDPTMPVNPYGETKLAAEKMIQWAAAAHDLNYCILRYFNVAGSGFDTNLGIQHDQLTHLIPIIMQTALGQREKFYVYGDDYDTPDGTCIRDYIHVTDLAKAHVAGARHIMTADRSIIANLGSGQGYSVRQVLEQALELFDFPYEYSGRRPGDPACLIADISRAREAFGWQPELGLLDILKSDYEFRRKLGG